MMKKFCYNCGKLGHTYNVCTLPVMSYGMILYRIRDDEPRYLMIQRNYTPDFKELVRGKFDFEDPDYIAKLIKRITLHEINYIERYNHKALYHMIERFYKVRKNNQYREKYKKAHDNFQKLIDGYQNSSAKLIKFDKIVRSSNTSYCLEPDWGFPKGRRNYRGNEGDIECAIREAEEETGIGPDRYCIIPDLYGMEVYRGTNEIKYAHKYYVGQVDPNIVYYIDPNNKHQVGEIRKMGWYKYEECVAMMRPYHEEKKKVLLSIHERILRTIRQDQNQTQTRP